MTPYLLLMVSLTRLYMGDGIILRHHPRRDASTIWFGDLFTKKTGSYFNHILTRVNDTLFIINGVTMRRVNDTLLIINGVTDASLHWGTVLSYGITPRRDASIIWFGDLFTIKRVYVSTIF